MASGASNHGESGGPIVYMASNGVAANLLMVGILVAGVASLFGLELEAWPTVPFNQVEVSLHPATYMPTGMVLRLGATPRATIAEGADAVMQVVDSDDFESGQYFSGLRPARANARAYDPEARARLKRLSRELTGVGETGKSPPA